MHLLKKKQKTVCGDCTQLYRVYTCTNLVSLIFRTLIDTRETCLGLAKNLIE